MFIKIICCTLIINVVWSKPQLLKFEDGKIAVNFGGYHAEAGLGGLLTGNAAHGGLSAAASTPTGQSASAGLGGVINDEQTGGIGGGLYARASSGASDAKAEIGGSVDANGQVSGGYSATADKSIGSDYSNTAKVSESNTAGNKLTIVDEQPPAVGAQYNGLFSATKSVNIGSSLETNVVPTQPRQLTHIQKLRKRFHLLPHKVLTIEKRVYPPQIQTQTQTQYTNQYLPSAVPQSPAPVPLQPTIYKPTFQLPSLQHGFNFQKYFKFGANHGYNFGPPPPPPATQQISQSVTAQTVPQLSQTIAPPKLEAEKTVAVSSEKEIAAPLPVAPLSATKVAEVQYSSGFSSQQPQPQPIGVQSSIAQQGQVQYTSGFSSQHATNLIDNIFNIPIATLRAVNQLLSGKAAAVSNHGNVNFQKTLEINHG